MRFLASILAMISCQTVLADNWAVGPLSESSRPGISLMHRYDRQNAAHIYGSMLTEKASLGGEYLRFYGLSSWGSGVSPALYTGAGIIGETTKAEKEEENFYFRFPAGLNVALRYFRSEIFSDFALAAGPAPQTNLSQRIRIGMRAVF